MSLEAPSRVPLPSNQLIYHMISFVVNLYLNWKSCGLFQGGDPGREGITHTNIDTNK